MAETSPNAGDNPGTRGRLNIADRVAERIATFAAGEVAGVVSTGSTLEGVLGRRYPKADAEVAGQYARVTVDVAVSWPSPLATTAESVRERVRTRLTDLAGLQVDVVNVTVAKVIHEEPTQERRVQ